MKIESFREKKSNFIVYFLADVGVAISSKLFKICIPYARLHKVEFDEEEFDTEGGVF